MHISSRAIAGITFLLFTQIFAAKASFLIHTPDYVTQIGVGGISGKIMGNMEAVRGADVVLMQKDKLIDKTSTDENGNYAFKYLSPGNYDIKATKPGYRTSIIITIPVDEDETTGNDFYLPQFNNAHMIKTPIVETYEENFHRYIRHK